MVRAVQSLFKILLAVALLWAPVLPDIASAAGAHPAHAQHHADHGDHTSSAVNHAAHDHTQAGDNASDQHASCSGNCCATCAHCGMAPLEIAATGSPVRPVQVATTQQLHDTLIVSAPSRPPQAR